jgi:hypothetical protein
MIATTMHTSLLDRLIAAVRGAVADILGSSSGFGHANFDVVGGQLIPRSVTVTHQPENGESIEVLISRLQTSGEWRDGDLVEFVYNKHRLQLVRITRNPPRVAIEVGS